MHDVMNWIIIIVLFLLLTSTHISEDDQKQYSTVIEKFETFFKVRKIVIFEKAHFNRHCQAEGKLAEQFITTVYSLV